MIVGILIVLGLGFAGAVIGGFVGDWWASKMPEGAELEALWPPILGVFGGGLAGLGLGVRIAYVLGRRRRGD